MLTGHIFEKGKTRIRLLRPLSEAVLVEREKAFFALPMHVYDRPDEKSGLDGHTALLVENGDSRVLLALYRFLEKHDMLETRCNDDLLVKGWMGGGDEEEDEPSWLHFFITEIWTPITFVIAEKRLPTNEEVLAAATRFLDEREGKRVREPDYDLRAYLMYNNDIFTLDQIANIHAEIPGHNDADNWYWIIELTNGRFLLTQAWCDCTGWDCVSGGESQIAASAEEAARLASNDYIKANLLAQLRGEQAFGVEVRAYEE